MRRPVINRQRVARRPPFGFTLVELLVAVSLMAILAAMSWRGLDSVLKARDSLGANSDDLKSLSVALSQLDEDLRRSWPMRQLVKETRSIRVLPQDGSVQIELLREGGGALDPVRAERVRYRLDRQQFQRGFAPYSLGSAAQFSTFTWQDLVPSVDRLAFRVWVKGQGWLEAQSLFGAENSGSSPAGSALIPPTSNPPGSNPPGPSANSGPEILGVELVLTRLSGEQYRRVYSVRD
jgi:general secretion pathway protein J